MVFAILFFAVQDKSPFYHYGIGAEHLIRVSNLEKKF